MSQFLVLRTLPYQENHLLVNLLSQNGCVYTVLCMGGQGSVKKKTGQKAEIGQVLKISNFHVSSKFTQYYSLREFEVVWSPRHIRNSYHAWGVLNFISEVCMQLIPQRDLNKNEIEEHLTETITSRDYEVITKFIMLIDDWCLADFGQKDNQIIAVLFLTKLMMLHGLMPSIKQCQHCQAALRKENVAFFQSPDFFCSACHEVAWKSQQTWNFLTWAAEEKYEKLRILARADRKYLELDFFNYLLNEFFFLLNISKNNLKTLSLISG